MALVVAAVLVGAVLQSATGFGGALVIAPALFAAFDLPTAITILALLGIVVSVLVLTERRAREVARGEVARLCAWALPGMAAGVVILALVSKPVLQVVVGLGVFGAVAVNARMGARALPTAPVGLVTGALTTTTGINGPPMVLHLHGLGFTPAATRDTLAACFLVLDVMAVPVLAAGGQLSLVGTSALGVAGLVVLVAVGRAIGREVFERLDHERFRRAGLVLVAAAGAASIVAGFTT